MKRCVGVSLFALSLALAGGSLVWGPSARAADGPLKQPGRWSQDETGRPADPAVRFGTLANGLRYAIMRNETPKDGVAMRMRIGSGSMVERDDEQGLAHFLEHMAFRGSANVPDGEVVHMLERQGLRFGPDTNAFTAQDQTVYMFTFPKADASALNTGFTLFREIGQRLNLNPAAMDKERGVILSEERLRDTPDYEAMKADYANVLAGSRAVARWPIGQVDIIKKATSKELRRYYEANYRPGNATLIVVGNIDPAKVEAEIRARFSDWHAAGPADTVDPGTVVPAHPTAEYVAAGAPDGLALSWLGPVDKRAETQAVDREQVVRDVALTVLNDRFADRAAQAGSPFSGARAGYDPDTFKAAATTGISIVAPPGQWQAALAAVVEEQRQLLHQGVTAADLQRAVTQVRTRLREAVAKAPTRDNGDLADELVDAVNEDDLFTSPAQDLAFSEPVLAGLTATEVDAALKGLFAGKGPVLFRSAQSGPATAAALEGQLQADYARPLEARAQEKAITWPYTDFGAAGRVTATREDKELGATVVDFANGTRLIVKPTSFEKDRIQVRVDLGQGRAGVEPALAHALWAGSFLPYGGTGKLSQGDITRWVESTGKVVHAQVTVGDTAFVLSGVTRPADFLTQMQELAAFARDPGFRPELEDKVKAIGPMFAGQLDANAGAVFSREVQLLTAGGDPRFVTLPTSSDVAATRAGDLPALLRGPLAGPADITVVGDVTVADAIAAVRATFAAGPVLTRGPLPAVSAGLPAGRAAPWVVTHRGRADQAYYGEFWSLPDYYADPHTSDVADVAAALMSSRLVDTVREKLGLTYAPQALARASLDVTGQAYWGALIETPAANFPTFHELLAHQVADLADKPISADELERAKKPLIDSREKEMEKNAFWSAFLARTLRDPRARVAITHRVSGIQEVTDQQVRDLLKRYVVDKAPVTIISRAAASPDPVVKPEGAR